MPYIDPEQERAIWERVRAGRSGTTMPQVSPAQEMNPSPPWVPDDEPQLPNFPECRPDTPCQPEHKPDDRPDGGCGCEPECTITPALLLDWICHESKDACLYQHLARCLPRCAYAMLMELAADEQCHARRLSAQYYVMTGCCPQIQPCFHPSHCPLELLRRRYQEELEGARLYRDAAGCATGTLLQTLDELSRDEARHSRTVMHLLECVL